MSSPIEQARRAAPAHWKWVPLKQVAEINARLLGEETDPDYTFRYIDISTVRGDGTLGEPAELRFADAPSRARRVIHAGDVIVSMVRTYLRAISRVPSLSENLVCSTGFAVLSAGPEMDPGFLHWWARSAPFVNEVVARSVGVSYPAITPEELGWLPTPVPPRPDQAAIREFLDLEMAHLDVLQQRLRDLMNLVETRFWAEASMATQSAGAYSGVHSPHTDTDAGKWKRVRLKNCFGRVDYGIGHRSLESGRFPVLGMANVGRGEVSEVADGFVEAVAPELVLQPGDLLFNRTNSLPLVGKVGLFRGESGAMTFASYLVRLRARPEFDPGFLNYLLNTEEVLALARSMALPSIGQANLNPRRYSEICVLIPPIDEQRRVTAHLDERAATARRARNHLWKQIELLRERCDALTTAAISRGATLDERC